MTIDEARNELYGTKSTNKPISLVGMNDTEFDKMPDEQWFYINKRMLLRLCEKLTGRGADG